MIRTTISRGKQTFKVGDFPDGGEAFEEAEVKALSKGWGEGTYKASFERVDLGDKSEQDISSCI